MDRLLKILTGLLIFGFITAFVYSCFEQEKDPDSIGSHWDYSIFCEGGFKYKQMRNSTIQMLNSDGTPLRCNKKRY